MTGVFVQMRVGSQRLPGKVLMEIAGLPMCRHVMRALNKVPGVKVVLTDAASEAQLGPHVYVEGWDLFVGPSEDVLRRYVLAAREYHVDTVFRACGDSPLLSAEMANWAMYMHRGADFTRFLGMPAGVGVELIRTKALVKADCETTSAYDRQHVSPYILTSGKFHVQELDAPYDVSLVGSVAVDTQGDLERVRRIFKALYRGDPIEAQQLVAYLRGHPALAGADVIERQMAGTLFSVAQKVCHAG